MKKLISILLVLALALSLLPMSVFAADNSCYYRRYTGESSSLVDALKTLGVDSSFTYRSKIAAANGIQSYVGSSQQNIRLLSLLKAGVLKSPEASIKTPQVTSQTMPQTNPKQPTSQPETTQSATQVEVAPTQPSYNYTCSDYSECTQDDAKIYVITKNNCAIREDPCNTGKNCCLWTEGTTCFCKAGVLDLEAYKMG